MMDAEQNINTNQERDGLHSNANAIQYGGSHYKSLGIEPWDYVVANNIGFLEGNAIKYLSRWREKGGIEDIKKAQHYIQKLLEIETKKASK